MSLSLFLAKTSPNGLIQEWRTAAANLGDNLGDSLRSFNIDWPAPCGGHGHCGACVIRGIEAKADFQPDSIPLPIPSEQLGFPPCSGLHSLEPPASSSILACQTAVARSMILLIPEDRWRRQDEILQEESNLGIFPNVSDPSERVSSACSSESPKSLGVAVDLGSTTIAAALIDLDSGQILAEASRWNPQAAKGADIINRIVYARQSQDALEELRLMAVEAMNALIDPLTANAGQSREQIKRVAVAGNSVMATIFLGLDPKPLGEYPFAPPAFEFDPISASSLGIPIAPGGEIAIFPLLASFIGGDLTAGCLALETRRQRDPDFFTWGESGSELLIDIGTNGEILLFHRGKVIAVSTAAGPVFEGAAIYCGMTAQKGAVKSADFRIPPYWTKDADAFSAFPSEEKDASLAENLHLETVGGAPPRGICGSGLVDMTAEFLRVGLLTPRGKWAASDSLASQKYKDSFFQTEGGKAFRVSSPGDSPETNVFLHQKDIRQIQLAVGAIRTGIFFLLDQVGTKFQDLRKVYLAGGFGNKIRRENAIRIGLLPPVPIDRIEYCGNTSLSGSLAVLTRPDLWTLAASIRPRLTHLDLARDPRFPAVFAESMIFPQPASDEK